MVRNNNRQSVPRTARGERVGRPVTYRVVPRPAGEAGCDKPAPNALLRELVVRSSYAEVTYGIVGYGYSKHHPS